MATAYYGVNTESEVFNEFAKIAKKEKLIKTAEEDTNVKDKYGVTGGTGEEEVNKAHPGGGPVVAEAAGDHAKVETIVEQHRKMEEVALKTPTGKLAHVIHNLQKMATQIEEECLTSDAALAFSVGKVLDAAVEKLVILAAKAKDKEDKKKDKEDKEDDKEDKKKDKKKDKEDKEDKEDDKEDKEEKVAFTVTV
jgi:hypothetical protein